MCSNDKQSMKIILLTLLINPTFITASPVLVKPGTRDFTNSFSIGVDNFVKMIRKNKIFVDNSLLIKECVQLNHSLYIVGPSKSGKTINLDMLKTFFEIQVDEYGDQILPKTNTSNYRLFVHGEVRMENGAVERMETRLLISRYKKLIYEHLGEYPVVYVNFKNVRGDNVEEVRESIGRAIRQAYLQHQYMIQVLRNLAKLNETIFAETYTAEEDLQSFEKIINNEESMYGLENRVKDLCRILANNFRRDPVIIFDDYDRPLINILQTNKFPKEDAAEVARTMDRLTMCSFLTNAHKRWAFVVTTIELSQYSWSPWYKYKRMDVLLDDSSPIARYFYFNEKTIQDFFNIHNLTSEYAHRAYKWYKGFQSNQFNIHSIANFLNTKKFTNYFNDQDFEEIAIQLLSTNIQIRREISSLLSNRTFAITYQKAQTSIAEPELYKLIPQIFASNAQYTNETISTFKFFLIKYGYLGVHLTHHTQEASNDVPRLVEFRIPNRDIASLMCCWLISYYRQKYNIDDDLLQHTAITLLQFVNNTVNSASALEHHLAQLYNRTLPLISQEVTEHDSNVENPLHAIFTSIALKVQNITEFEVDVFYPRSTECQSQDQNYAIHDYRSSQAIILQLNRNQSVQDTLKSIKKYEIDILEELEHPKTVRLVVINICPNQTVNIYAKSNKFLILDR